MTRYIGKSVLNKSLYQFQSNKQRAESLNKFDESSPGDSDVATEGFILSWAREGEVQLSSIRARIFAQTYNY